MKQKKVILSIILIALVAVGVYLANSGIFYKKIIEKNLELTQSLPSCDLHTSSCSVKVANNKNIILDIVKPLKSNSDIVFNVTTDFNAKELKISIFGVNMDMGLFATTLKKTSDGRYTGTLKLPTCMKSGKMMWQINVVDESSKVGASYIVTIK